MASIVKSFNGSPAVPAVAEVKVEGKPYVAAKDAKPAVEAGYTVCLSQTELDWVVTALGMNASSREGSAFTFHLFDKLEGYSSEDRRLGYVNGPNSICIPG
jgi:hypothetical protein